jgi:hypothetical protein
MVMISLRSLCKPNAARRYGFTNFLFLDGELKRVDMNASRTGSSATVYFELRDLHRFQIATFEPRSGMRPRATLPHPAAGIAVVLT